MIGKISTLPGPGGTPGCLTANNGRKYTFTAGGWVAPSVVPAVGMGVEFEPSVTHAVRIRPAGQPFHGRRPAPGAAAGQAQRQANPPSKRQLIKPPSTVNPQQRSKRSQGSMPAAVRSMLAIMMVTPFTVPLFFLLPLIGRIELVSMVLFAGFIGGHSAAGIRKALAAAVLVGASHGFVVYLMVLVAFQLLIGVPLVGSYVRDVIGFFGGLAVASSLVTVIVALPAFLILCVSAVIGALTARTKP